MQYLNGPAQKKPDYDKKESVPKRAGLGPCIHLKVNI